MPRKPKTKTSLKVNLVLTGVPLDKVMKEKQRYDEKSIMISKSDIVNRLLDYKEDKRLL